MGSKTKTMIPKPTYCDMLLSIKFGMANTGMPVDQGTWVFLHQPPGFNIFTDIWFASLPIPTIVKFQLKLRRWIYLVMVLSLGYLYVDWKEFLYLGVLTIAHPKRRGPGHCQTILSNRVWCREGQDLQPVHPILGLVCLLIEPTLPRNTYKSIDTHSLQLNVGIIAACCPALKPLIGTAFRLSRRAEMYGNYGNIAGSGPAVLGDGSGGNRRADMSYIRMIVVSRCKSRARTH